MRAHACCDGCNAGDAGPDAPDGDALHGASSTRKPGEPAKTADTGCCVSCKDRVLPAELSVPLGDTIGADILVATALLLDIVEARAQLGVWTHFGTGPPGAPSGRTILAQAGILLV